VVETRARALGVKVRVAKVSEFVFNGGTFGCLIQYPDTNGLLIDIKPVIDQAHAAGALATVASDLLALCLLKSPGSLGADIVVGSAQRFGVPLGYGGPHAAFFATKDEYKRSMPGRLVGVSKDASGKSALRLALQTREQHIRREKATSNICTAQVLLAVMASMYAVYHGPKGLRGIAERVQRMASTFSRLVVKGGVSVVNQGFFDTVRLELGAKNATKVAALAEASQLLVRIVSDSSVVVSFDEAKGVGDLVALLAVFGVSVSIAEAERASSRGGLP
jgi:glycine dehydrogenase